LDDQASDVPSYNPSFNPSDNEEEDGEGEEQGEEDGEQEAGQGEDSEPVSPSLPLPEAAPRLILRPTNTSPYKEPQQQQQEQEGAGQADDDTPTPIIDMAELCGETMAAETEEDLLSPVDKVPRAARDVTKPRPLTIIPIESQEGDGIVGFGSTQPQQQYFFIFFIFLISLTSFPLSLGVAWLTR
jgi:hypothetical protein